MIVKTGFVKRVLLAGAAAMAIAAPVTGIATGSSAVVADPAPCYDGDGVSCANVPGANASAGNGGASASVPGANATADNGGASASVPGANATAGPGGAGFCINGFCANAG